MRRQAIAQSPIAFCNAFAGNPGINTVRFQILCDDRIRGGYTAAADPAAGQYGRSKCDPAIILYTDRSPVCPEVRILIGMLQGPNSHL